jgi:tryptophanyl-tRNA synthetase
MSSSSRPIILTGDRTTGPLHIGHYVGSLRSRIELQHTHQQYVLLADAQALTDNAHDVEKVRSNVIEVALDYLAVGIDPELSAICVQSTSSLSPASNEILRSKRRFQHVVLGAIFLQGSFATRRHRRLT